jgi:hypothetical protein
MLHKDYNCVQLENEITGRESQGACGQELIGGKPPVVK